MAFSKAEVFQCIKYIESGWLVHVLHVFKVKINKIVDQNVCGLPPKSSTPHCSSKL